eukprot:TRINITY_DN1041_c0_g1_i2.p1 TRINITY_DN1041_c0_g1~~TRINITY_DN1041_c0_g1_i2.p1  ORF type:complete len:314 (+),score=73.90 TRINITY_DN1041_c0_g1_i2:422-1363(+)
MFYVFLYCLSLRLADQSHTDKLKADVETFIQKAAEKDKEIQDLNASLAIKQRDVATLTQLRSEVAEQDKLLGELNKKLDDLLKERHEKTSTLNASQDKNLLKELLAPNEKQQISIKAEIAQLSEEKKHKTLELKILREEKKKIQRLTVQKEDLEERVMLGEERLSQLSHEHRDLTERLAEMRLRKQEAENNSKQLELDLTNTHNLTKQSKLEELQNLYQTIEELRKNAHGSNTKPTTFSWQSTSASCVSLCGSFPSECFSVPHLLKRCSDNDSTWSVTLNLPPGSYHYKFLVDGEYKLDENLAKDGDNNVINV